MKQLKLRNTSNSAHRNRDQAKLKRTHQWAIINGKEVHIRSRKASPLFRGLEIVIDPPPVTSCVPSNDDNDLEIATLLAKVDQNDEKENQIEVGQSNENRRDFAFVENLCELDFYMHLNDDIEQFPCPLY
jgi:hypothetical protein